MQITKSIRATELAQALKTLWATHELRGRDGAGRILAALLGVSLIVNVLLAHRVRSLTAGISNQGRTQLLKAGTVVPPINVKQLGQNRQTISYAGTNRPSVLYVLRPGCVWCTRNMDNFKTLLSKEGDRYRFIVLSLSEEGLAAQKALGKATTALVVNEPK
jgi:hypothetical protein